MPGSRHGGTHVAPFGLLPVQGLHPRARTARGLKWPDFCSAFIVRRLAPLDSYQYSVSTASGVL